MQAGFATLSAGSIRAKNVKNILLKNLLDARILAESKACHRHGRPKRPKRLSGRGKSTPRAASAADRGLRSATGQPEVI